MPNAKYRFQLFWLIFGTCQVFFKRPATGKLVYILNVFYK